MKKELKDFIHLYLGCDVFFDRTTWEFAGITPSYILLRHRSRTDDLGLLSRVKVGTHDVNLILRKLSDMTKDEALEFINDVFKFREQFGHRITEYKNEKGFLSFKYSNSNGGGGGNEQGVLLIKNWGKDGNGEWIFNCSYSMSDVVWLLKKSFDIFGLIESGLAIDATTLNKEAK